ncbi:hypothetical protein WN50_18150 [Limnoraphis robusta CS-951]|uniref:Uncharacterized protein n=2 Tax=Limnoraphis TaxID=1332112 RepID=A0A0F5YCY1_9CYAN|nr:hypothetical protein WN50_18150 [Limnoraphis robusta CS-951]
MGVGQVTSPQEELTRHYSQATAILYNEIYLIEEGRMLVRVWVFFYKNRRENPVALCAGMRGEAGDGGQYPVASQQSVGMTINPSASEFQCIS